jgi:putative membrane protein
MISTLALLIAQVDDDHMDWDGGWWVLMALGMIVFWGLVIFGIVWLVRELAGHRGHHGHGPGPRADDPLAILDRRLADGSIAPEEYRERRAALTEHASGRRGSG